MSKPKKSKPATVPTPDQVEQLRRIQRDSQKLVDELESIMRTISAANGGQVPRGLITALSGGQIMAKFIWLTIDE